MFLIVKRGGVGRMENDAFYNEIKELLAKGKEVLIGIIKGIMPIVQKIN